MLVPMRLATALHLWGFNQINHIKLASAISYPIDYAVKIKIKVIPLLSTLCICSEDLVSTINAFKGNLIPCKSQTQFP